MTPVAVPPVRDRHERCPDCGQWSRHSVSVRRGSAPGTRLGAYRLVECLACGATTTRRLDEVNSGSRRS